MRLAEMLHTQFQGFQNSCVQATSFEFLILLQHVTRVDKINFHASSDGSDTGSDKDAGAGERKKHRSEFFLMIFSNSHYVLININIVFRA